MLIPELKTLIESDPTLFALVGNRVYPSKAKQSSDFPFIVILGASVRTTKTKNNNEQKLDFPSFSLLVFDIKYKPTIQVSENLRRVLDDYYLNGINIEYITQSGSFNQQAELFIENNTYNVTYSHSI